MHPDDGEIARIAELLANGVLQPRIQRVGSLDEIRDLFVELDEGHVVGKLLVTFSRARIAEGPDARMCPGLLCGSGSGSERTARLPGDANV